MLHRTNPHSLWRPFPEVTSHISAVDVAHTPKLVQVPFALEQRMVFAYRSLFGFLKRVHGLRPLLIEPFKGECGRIVIPEDSEALDHFRT